MENAKNKVLYNLAFIMVILAIVATAIGVFYTTGGEV